MTQTKKLERATFAAGCFWGVEATFRRIKGVTDTQVGYTGGHTDNPTYKEVCNASTGHAEAIEITFDPSLVSYDELLEVFFKNHNPTTVDRQGPDEGNQYRSAIFYHLASQKRSAEEAIERHQPNWDDPIVTEIVEATKFFPAEEYHQRYLEKKGLNVCH